MQKKNFIRLNKFLAHAGLGTRRKCDEFIKDGFIKVNGTIITEAGVKVNVDDKILYNGELVQVEKKVYILLNKPKNISSFKTDEEKIKSIFYLTFAYIEKLNLGYNANLKPLDILDIDELGLTVLTNDKKVLEKAKDSYSLQKIYRIKLNKKLSFSDYIQILESFPIKSGKFKVKELNYLDEEDKSILGIKIHISDNKAIHNLFNKLDYKIVSIDRTVLGVMTKRDLPRGRWRFLKPDEIVKLKY